VFDRLTKTLKMRNVVFLPAMTNSRAPAPRLTPLDLENAFNPRLIASAQSPILIILGGCCEAKIAEPIVSALAIDVIHLNGRVFTTMQSPGNTMNAGHFSINANLQMARIEKCAAHLASITGR